MSKNLNIFIVEDEPLICATIETALRKQGIKVVGDSDNFLDALQAIKMLQPDLVLLDIQLEGIKDGIDLALKLDQMSIPYLYLTSQTDPETIERIKVTQPLGYIVKPFTESGLRSNIELAWHNFSLTSDDYFLVKHEGRLHKLNQKDITYLQAYDNYCYINTRTSQYLVPHTLKHTFEKLNSDHFIRSHRSYVVNLKHVTSFNNKMVYLDDLSIPLSASQRPILKQNLE
ncbi:LytR/AlgR family response regulator transcription factor [Psychroserpens sp. MEBiC05023]